MAIRVAINGFGRIGRLVLRAGLQHPELEFVGINDLMETDHLAYMFKYDSTHGQYQGEVSHQEQDLIVDGKKIQTSAIRNPSELPWQDLGVDVVVESTGLFTTHDTAKQHLEAGAKRVVISAPTKTPETVNTFVLGVNEEKYDSFKDLIVSNASCTTNCLAPVVKVLLDHFGIEEGLMTTVHAVTANQPTVDGPSKKDWRGGRGGMQNIIPASTGAAKAVALCLPEVKGKLTGMAFRVPVPDVSVIDLTVKLSQSTTLAEINKKMKEASEGSLKGILAYTEEAVVSNDFLGSSFSSIYDATAGIELNDHFFKLVSWYDNEMGYSNRIVELVHYVMMH